MPAGMIHGTLYCQTSAFRKLDAALRGRCQPRDLLAAMLAQHILWRATKKGKKQTGTHRFVPLLVEHHVAQTNDLALTVRSPVVSACVCGYAHHLGVARKP